VVTGDATHGIHELRQVTADVIDFGSVDHLSVF